MKKLIIPLALIGVLAGAALAQTTTAPLAWNEALLTWKQPTEYAEPGGSLPSPLPSITYIVESLDPGKTEWRVQKTLTGTSHKLSGLIVGTYQWRVSAQWTGSPLPPGPPTAPVSKTITPPRLASPLAFTVQ